jgi:hypothetical protein
MVNLKRPQKVSHSTAKKASRVNGIRNDGGRFAAQSDLPVGRITYKAMVRCGAPADALPLDWPFEAPPTEFAEARSAGMDG